MGPLGWFVAGMIAKDILGKDCKQEKRKQMTHQEMFPYSSPLNVIKKDEDKETSDISEILESMNRRKR